MLLGLRVLLLQLAVTIGILAAQLINYGTKDVKPYGWRIRWVGLLEGPLLSPCQLDILQLNIYVLNSAHAAISQRHCPTTYSHYLQPAPPLAATQKCIGRQHLGD